MTPDAAINALARAQLGLFTRAQARAAGATDAFLQRRVGKHLYRSLHRGVYAVTSVPASWHQEVLAVCLSRREIVAARRTAAALWELPGFSPGPLEFCSLHNVRSRDRIRIRRVGVLPIADVVPVGPIRATSATRTIIDLSSDADAAQLEAALDEARRRGLTSLAYLQRRLEDLVGRTNIRAGIVRDLLEDRSARSAAAESVLETKAIQLLRRSGLPAPQRQHEIWADGALVARVDLAYPHQKIAVEVDGYEHHSAKQQWERDLLRRNRLEAAGWRVLHVTAQQLRSHQETFIETLRHTLEVENGRQLPLGDSW
jgi:very-short-patch-repair endonuclease